MIGILRYDAGNLRSVQNALCRLQIPHFVSDEQSELEKAEKIIFPGVGHAAACMRSLAETGLDRFLRQTRKPVLAICVGMQLLFDHSGEGDTACLGIIPGSVRKFDAGIVGTVPHMGWNEVCLLQDTSDYAAWQPVVDCLSGRDEDFYFVHSFYCVPEKKGDVLAVTEYNEQKFCSIVRSENFLGVQFHPEKSGKIGEELLKAFAHN